MKILRVKKMSTMHNIWTFSFDDALYEIAGRFNAAGDSSGWSFPDARACHRDEMVAACKAIGLVPSMLPQKPGDDAWVPPVQEEKAVTPIEFTEHSNGIMWWPSRTSEYPSYDRYYPVKVARGSMAERSAALHIHVSNDLSKCMVIDQEQVSSKWTAEHLKSVVLDTLRDLSQWKLSQFPPNRAEARGEFFEMQHPLLPYGVKARVSMDSRRNGIVLSADDVLFVDEDGTKVITGLPQEWHALVAEAVELLRRLHRDEPPSKLSLWDGPPVSMTVTRAPKESKEAKKPERWYKLKTAKHLGGNKIELSVQGLHPGDDHDALLVYTPTVSPSGSQLTGPAVGQHLDELSYAIFDAGLTVARIIGMAAGEVWTAQGHTLPHGVSRKRVRNLLNDALMGKVFVTSSEGTAGAMHSLKDSSGLSVIVGHVGVVYVSTTTPGIGVDHKLHAIDPDSESDLINSIHSTFDKLLPAKKDKTVTKKPSKELVLLAADYRGSGEFMMSFRANGAAPELVRGIWDKKSFRVGHYVDGEWEPLREPEPYLDAIRLAMQVSVGGRPRFSPAGMRVGDYVWVNPPLMRAIPLSFNADDVSNLLEDPKTTWEVNGPDKDHVTHISVENSLGLKVHFESSGRVYASTANGGRYRDLDPVGEAGLLEHAIVTLEEFMEEGGLTFEETVPSFQTRSNLPTKEKTTMATIKEKTVSTVKSAGSALKSDMKEAAFRSACKTAVLATRKAVVKLIEKQIEDSVARATFLAFLDSPAGEAFLSYAAGTVLPNLPIDQAQALRERAGAELRVQGMQEAMMFAMTFLLANVWTEEVQTAFKAAAALGEAAPSEVHAPAKSYSTEEEDD